MLLSKNTFYWKNKRQHFASVSKSRQISKRQQTHLSTLLLKMMTENRCNYIFSNVKPTTVISRTEIPRVFPFFIFSLVISVCLYLDSVPRSFFDHSIFEVSCGPGDSNPCSTAGEEKQGSLVGWVYQECRSNRPVNNAVIWEACRRKGERGVS